MGSVAQNEELNRSIPTYSGHQIKLEFKSSVFINSTSNPVVLEETEDKGQFSNHNFHVVYPSNALLLSKPIAHSLTHFNGLRIGIKRYGEKVSSISKLPIAYDAQCNSANFNVTFRETFVGRKSDNNT